MLSWRGTGLLAVGFWLGLASVVHAQAEPLAAGKEVRLFVRGVIAPFEGTLLSASPQALTLSMSDGSVFTISPAQVQLSEVLGSRRNTLRGGFLGAALGLGVGVWWVVRSRDCARDAYGFCDAGDSFDEWGLVLPPVLGGGAGALVGHLIRTPRWAPGFLPEGSPAGGIALEVTWAIPVRS